MLSATIDGQRTLRELSLLFNQDLLLFTRMVGLYLQKGWLELVEVPAQLLPDLLEASPAKSSIDLPDNASPPIVGTAIAGAAKIEEQPIESESVQTSGSGTPPRSVP
jgi:hypothetical protein